MRRMAKILPPIVILLAMLTSLPATAQEPATPTPIAVLVTVVLVTHTPTPTHTSTPGDTPTPTTTPTATYLSALPLPPTNGGVYGGQIDLSVTAGGGGDHRVVDDARHLDFVSFCAAKARTVWAMTLQLGELGILMVVLLPIFFSAAVYYVLLVLGDALVDGVLRLFSGLGFFRWDG